MFVLLKQNIDFTNKWGFRFYFPKEEMCSTGQNSRSEVEPLDHQLIDGMELEGG